MIIRYFQKLAVWGCIVMAIGCGEKIEPGNESKPVSTVRAVVATAGISSQAFIYEAMGTVSARTAGTLSGKIMGTVKSVTVTDRPIRRILRS